MKKIVLFLSLIVTFIVGYFQLSIWRASSSSPHLAIDDFRTTTAMPKVIAENNPAESFPNFPIGVPQKVMLNADNGTLNRLSQREWRDQIRDWLLQAVVGDSGLSAYDIGNVLFDLPPLRYAYTKASGQFEYDELRSRYIGNGEVVALVPAGASQTARDDAIADVVDRHRKDQAGDIKKIRLFEYSLANDALSAEVTQRDSINVADYLTPEKNYYEAIVHSPGDLQQLLTQIDDLTYAEVKPDGLLLGGRKLKSYEYRGVGLQEIAAIWQSERDIARQEIEWKKLVAEEEAAYRSRWRYRTYKANDYAAKRRLEAEAERDWKTVESRLQKQAKELRIVNGSGFSLDPDYDFDGLYTYLMDLDEDKTNQILKSRINNLIGGAVASKDMPLGQNQDQYLELLLPPLIKHILPEFKGSASALKQGNIIPLLTILSKLKESGNFSMILIAEVFEKEVNNFKFQAARYDGKLEGTEAGMVLFYTDLLAKIWALNYLDSAPVKDVEDFVDHTQVKRASIYDKESEELPSARLWFGPTDRGFQVAQNNQQLYFQRISTRIFSKGNNPLDPSNEVQTSAFLAAPIDWWDDHYAEVARYEPEYFRLNEIMKWSLVIGFLSEGNNTELLSFLDTFNVDRSNWFLEWAHNNKSLKFDLWDQIEFYESGYKGTTTEAMAMLYGQVTSGGVSLAPKTLFRDRVQISPSLNTLNRRSNINYAANLKPGEFKTMEGVTVKLQRVSPEKAAVHNTPKPDLRLRAADSDLRNAVFTRDITKTASGLKVEASSGGTKLGELNIEKTSKNGFSIGWQARDIDAGQTLVLRASRSPNPEAVFARDPMIEQVVKLPSKDTYAVKLQNSDKWMKVNKGGGNDSTVSKGWDSRVADPEKGSNSFQLVWVDKKTIENEIQQAHWMALDIPQKGRLVTADVSIRGPPAEGMAKVQLSLEGKSVTAIVDQSVSKIYIPIKEIPTKGSQSILDIPYYFGPKQLVEVRKSGSVSLVRSTPVEQAMQQGNFRHTAVEIANNPKAVAIALDAALSQQITKVSRMIAKGESNSALAHLQRLKQWYGPQLEFKLWEGLIKLSNGHTQQAVQALKQNTLGRIRNSDKFLEEIHSRLAQPSMNGKARDSFVNLKHFADWRYKKGNQKPQGNAVPIFDNGTLAFEFRIVNPFQKGRILPVDEVSLTKTGKNPIYRQDSPSFNSLDWNISPTQAYSQVVEMQLGKMVVLPRGDIAHLNPTKIVITTEPGSATSTTISHSLEFIHMGQFARAGSSPSSCLDSSCDEEEEEESLVYFLVDNSWPSETKEK